MQSTTPGPAQWSSGTTSGGTYRWMPPPSSCCSSLRWPHLVNISPRTCRLHLICILRTLLSHKSPKKFWCEKPKLIGRSKNSDDIIILKCICLSIPQDSISSTPKTKWTWFRTSCSTSRQLTKWLWVFIRGQQTKTLEGYMPPMNELRLSSTFSLLV